MKTMKQTLAGLGVTFVAFALHAAYWTGNTDSDWWTDTNWTDNTRPEDNASFTLESWLTPKTTLIDLDDKEVSLSKTVNVNGGPGYPFTFTNGTLNVGESLYVGESKREASQLTLADVTLAVTGDIQIGGSWTEENIGGTGTVVQTSGAVSAANLQLGYGTNCIARYELCGGTLAVGAVKGVWDSASEDVLLFNGGTLKATKAGALFDSSVTVKVGAGGFNIDSDEYDVSLSSESWWNLTTDENSSGLVKSGSGKLTLHNGKNWGGAISVLAGTLDLNNEGNAVSGDVTLGSTGSIVNFTKGDISTLTIVGNKSLAKSDWNPSTLVVKNGTLTLTDDDISIGTLVLDNGTLDIGAKGFWGGSISGTGAITSSSYPGGFTYTVSDDGNGATTVLTINGTANIGSAATVKIATTAFNHDCDWHTVLVADTIWSGAETVIENDNGTSHRYKCQVVRQDDKDLLQVARIPRGLVISIR